MVVNSCLYWVTYTQNHFFFFSIPGIPFDAVQKIKGFKAGFKIRLFSSSLMNKYPPSINDELIHNAIYMSCCR